MAQFRGTLRGGRGEASRLGDKQTGPTAHVNGWHCGIEAVAHHAGGQDHFNVYATGGSGGSGARTFLGVLTDGEWQPAKPKSDEDEDGGRGGRCRRCGNYDSECTGEDTPSLDDVQMRER